MNDTPGRPAKKGALTYRLYQLGRRITRLPLVGALIPKGLRTRVQGRLLTDVFDHMPDRRYMEASILPAIAASNPARVLDVGVDTYTEHYGRWFPPEPQCEYWTLDLNPHVARLRPPARHIVANVLDVASFFEPGSLDVVIMNGPFGYGIDRLDEQERTIEAVRTLLRPGGRLMVGWDLARDGRPVVMDDKALGDLRIKDPTELQSIRSHFRHEAPAGLPARVTFTDCAHVYDWFVLA
jgi:SAM-dependent methyltransferase